MQKRSYLGKQVRTPVTKLDPIPWMGAPGINIKLHCSEFTSHCPVTSQPDFATLLIEYTPCKFIVETKSLKLYLWTFRGKREFNEKLVDGIAKDFFKQISPEVVTVSGKFFARGGISVEAKSVYRKESDLSF